MTLRTRLNMEGPEGTYVAFVDPLYSLVNAYPLYLYDETEHEETDA